MQGLLLKDIYTLLSKTKFFLILIAFFALMPKASVSAFAIFYAVMLPVTALAYDEQAKWPQLAAMMPYSSQTLVVSKYLLGWLAVAGTSLLAWLGNILQAFFTGPANIASLLDGEIVYYIGLMLFLALCFMMLTLPVMFFLGVEKGRLVNLVVLVLVIILLSMFIANDNGWLDWFEALGSQRMYLVLLAVAAVAVVGNLLSLLLSIWLYQRKLLQGGNI